MPEAVDALLDRDGDREWARRCLAAIFRRRIHRDPIELFRAAERWPADLMVLAPFITPGTPKQVVIDWAFLGFPAWRGLRLGPGDMGWRPWVRQQQALSDMGM